MVLIALSVWIVALIFRATALTANTPFWVDEFSTGTIARMILDKGLNVYLNPPPGFETNNSLTYVLTAAFFLISGQSENVARIPAFIVGSLVPVAVYFLARKLGGTLAGFIASLLTATSYFQIVWSLQARSYMLLQLMVVLTIIIGLKVIQTRRISPALIFISALTFIIGLASHYLYFLAFGSVCLYSVVLKRESLITKKSSLIIMVFLTFMLVTFLWSIGFLNLMGTFVRSSFFLSNNVWYYHSFLWREYGLILFISILGYILITKRNSHDVGLITFYFLIHLVFVTFLFAHHMSKYLLPIFPLLFVGAGLFIAEIGKIIAQRLGDLRLNKRLVINTTVLCTMIALGLTAFIIGNGHKFVAKPKKYYSINHDFREIANIDYHAIYRTISTSIHNYPGEQVAVIETWPSRAYWYLGQEYVPIYLFRWQNEEGFVNGHVKKTSFLINSKGEKFATNNLGFVAEKNDLFLAMEKYPKGYIFIDDDTLPRDVIDYAEKHLKKEMFLDHYPLDDNPYSKWPATLYSWGFK